MNASSCGRGETPPLQLAVGGTHSNIISSKINPAHFSFAILVLFPYGWMHSFKHQKVNDHVTGALPSKLPTKSYDGTRSMDSPWCECKAILIVPQRGTQPPSDLSNWNYWLKRRPPVGSGCGNIVIPDESAVGGWDPVSSNPLFYLDSGYPPSAYSGMTVSANTPLHLTQQKVLYSLRCCGAIRHPGQFSLRRTRAGIQKESDYIEFSLNSAKKVLLWKTENAALLLMKS